jgi:endonuclease YncB( thermonuclease family)
MLGRTGDDWATFNHRTFHVTGVVSGDVLTLATDNGRSQTVKLLGIVAPMGSEKGAAESRCFLTEQALNHNVTLLLPLPQTRDDRGRLLAYVFVDGENLSVAITKAGMAYADRRDRQLMAGLIEPAEAEARKKNRAMWKDLKFDQMPPWRQEWFQTLQRLSRTLK